MWDVDSNSTVLVLYYVEKYTSVRGSCHHAAEKCFPLRCRFESQTLRSASCSGALCQYYYIWLSVATQCLGFKVLLMFDLYSGLILKHLKDKHWQGMLQLRYQTKELRHNWTKTRITTMCSCCWCADATEVLMLLMHCSCYVLLLQMRWCCWSIVAADALMLMMPWCCWCTVAANVLMLLNQDQDFLADLSIAICSSFIYKNPLTFCFLPFIWYNGKQCRRNDQGGHCQQHHLCAHHCHGCGFAVVPKKVFIGHNLLPCIISNY